MEFEYVHQAERECVAYLDERGDLRIRDTGRLAENKRAAIILKQSGEMKNGYLFEPENAERRFYAGDKITITF